MFRIGNLCTITGLITITMLLSGAGESPRGTPPNFAPDDHTSWVPARPEGDEFIAPERGLGPVMAEKDHPYIPNRGGQPTYRIADLGNPNLKPWVVEKLKAANDRVRAGQVPFLPHERCWPGGVPGWEVYTRVRPLYFVQTPQKVTMIDELDHQVRQIYMNVPHSRNVKTSWYGELVGHYEGDELVVDSCRIERQASGGQLRHTAYRQDSRYRTFQARRWRKDFAGDGHRG